MAKFWFISAPLFGHLDWGGFLKTAQSLKAAGHDVTWVSQPKVGGYLLQNGIAFEPIEETGWLWPPPPQPDLTKIKPQEAVYLRYRRALDTWLSEDLIPTAVNAILNLADRIGKPDVLVTDPFLTAAAIAAEKLDIKLAVCGWPANADLDETKLFPVQKELAIDSHGRIQRLCDQFGVSGQNFAKGSTPSIQSPHLHISYFSEGWYQSDLKFLPQSKFVGGTPQSPISDPPKWLTDLPDQQPAVLITLGTVFTGDLGFYAWAAQATHRLGWIPIVVIGHTPMSPDAKSQLIAALPSQTRLLNWVDFDHVLPRMAAIVHHGGMGTTHAAAIHALPQIIVPHAADQRGQAKRVSQSKIGLHLTPHDVQTGQLLPAIRAVATDENVQNHCRQFADKLKSLGGPQKAAQILINLLQ
jgi:MGT family glycosyltransferase